MLIAITGTKEQNSRNLQIPATLRLSFFMMRPPAIIPITAAGISTAPEKWIKQVWFTTLKKKIIISIF